jgi:carbonic anhydrase
VTPAIHPEVQKTTTLLVSCIDSDLRSEVQDFMENTLQLKDTYDEFMMPGAALSYLQVAYPEWSRTLEDVIKVAKNNQGIKRVIFLDHLECQAYKLLHPLYARESHEKQLEGHKKTFSEVRKKLSKVFPDLEIHTLVMDDQGTILNIKE